MMKKPLIQLKNINKFFSVGKKQQLQVLKSLDLTIYEGEFIMIMGKSGSGKTTLMNIIGFLDRVSDGEYLFNGEDVSKLSENEKSEFRNKYLGFIFQQFFLINSLNVSQNVQLPCTYGGTKNKQTKQRIANNYLSLVDLADKGKAKVTELSGGQQQRVAIARSLVNDPLLIMADEPTGALDSQTGKEIMEMLQKLNHEGKTIVMVTHDADMTKYATRVIHMKDGCFTEEEGNQ
ncbi:putative ABC transport system ATP-binding protein [Enterococcus sp. PF1-24]|uniref:ABC transporter ATP-binding protein n=1 Tax=unclassified Enterococcus TaxID=2608891 RepID=UPI002475B6A2|nr:MULTISPECIES: ABC transporter ATP-binding protein [unclassified Enterococcus]MDH6365746.1 putative ABC transport system ATP-binding protein [Enterococcus sp. PFB1-1]MDH6402846.1 putative ABC transport system ATP-binding protein [Enterococcus sp. PF1-24]